MSWRGVFRILLRSGGRECFFSRFFLHNFRFSCSLVWNKTFWSRCHQISFFKLRIYLLLSAMNVFFLFLVRFFSFFSSCAYLIKYFPAWHFRITTDTRTNTRTQTLRYCSRCSPDFSAWFSMYYMSKKQWPIFIVCYYIKWITTSWTQYQAELNVNRKHREMRLVSFHSLFFFLTNFTSQI